MGRRTAADILREKGRDPVKLEGRRVHVHPDKANPSNPPYECPSCGNRKPADMMVYVDGRYICTGCEHHLERLGEIEKRR